MATNPFGFGPMGLPSKAPEEPAAKKARIDSLAIKTSVPANVLLALEERGENVETRASEIASQIGAGKRLEEVIDPETMGRAYDIADALYPRAAEPGPAPEKSEPGVAGDMRRQFTGALVRGIGGMADAVGSAADIYADGGIKLDPKESVAGKVARAVGAEIADYGSSIQAGVSEASKQAIAESTPDGDILDPSTWTFGEAPSLRGYAMLGADVMGSFLPVVATAVVTKSPTAAAGVGGAQGGGAAAQAARDAIEEMASTPHADGGTVLDHESAYFRELIAAGVPRDEAIRRTTRAAEHTAFLMTAPVSTFGGAATGKIIAPGLGAVAGRGIATRAAGTAAASALEEGAQEAMESVATKAGINAGAGTDLSLTEGTFADFILGAMGGGPVGAASGAMNRDTRDDGSVAGQAGAPGTVPPGDGAGAPATNMPGSEPGVAPDTPGSAPLGPPGQGGGAAIEGPLTPPTGPADLEAPAGPLTQISRLAPDLTPVPEPEPPAARFPDFKPGREVRLVDPETGAIEDAVFLTEAPDGGVTVRIAGQPVAMSDEVFDQARIEAMDADQAAKGKPARPKAVAEVPAPAVKPPAGPKRAEMSPEAALAQAKKIEETAARGGWNNRLRAKHAEFMTKAGGASDGAMPATADDVAPSRKPAAEKRDDHQGRGQGPEGVDKDRGGASPARGGTGGAAGVVPDGGPTNDVAAVGAAQSDLFGTQTPEARRKAKQEFDHVLDLTETGKSSADATLEGREVLIRGGRVIIRAEKGAPSPKDFRLDATGMDREQIAIELRFALDDLNRRAPMSPPPLGEAAPVQPPAAAEATAGAKPTPEKTSEPEAGEQYGPDARNDILLTLREIFDDALAGKERGNISGVAVSSIDFDYIKAGALAFIDGKDAPPVASSREGKILSDFGFNKAKQQIKALGYAPVSDRKSASQTAQPQPKPQQDKPSGLLGSLSAEKQARAEELKKRLADKARNQTSSGLDPEYITLGGELVKLYLEAGVRRFGQMLRDFAGTTGLTLKQAQEPMRAAYNHVRDNMDLEGEDTAGMDDAAAVLEEARAAIKGGNPPPEPPVKPKEDAAEAAQAPAEQPVNPVSIEDIREKAAILRGVPEDQPPSIEGISLKWDAREQGFVFSRKHKEKVEAAVKAMAAPAPSRAEVTEAARETDPSPTPAQAEAENYKTGKVNWRGLTLSIENAKGSTRRKVTPDGKTAWEVKMPADYGRILGTTGADGDHVDFYMGPYPDQEIVYVVDQKDAETGAFDEHKVMLGFKNQKAALEAYFAGFSDGKGPQRKMAVTPMGYVDLILNLKNNPGIWKGPISNTSAAPEPKPKAPPAAKKSDGGADRPMDLEKLRAADFGAWDSQTREDGQKSPAKRLGRDETGRWARALVKALKDNGFTSDEADARGGKARPYKEVDFGWGMAGEFDETSVHLKAPNGLHFYLSLRNGWSKGQLFTILIQFTGEPEKPGYSRPFIGPNTYLPEDITPQRAAEEIVIMAEKRGAMVKRDTATTPTGAPTTFAGALTDKLKQDFGPGISDKVVIIGPDAAPSSDPEIPAGLELTSVKRLSAAEQKARPGSMPGDFQAIIRRATPYGVYDGFGPTRAEAITRALGAAGALTEKPTKPDIAAADIAAFEAVGMVKGKSTVEDAWFRKQAEPGGIATYKAKSVKAGWKLTRDFTPDKTTAPPTRDLGVFARAADAIAQLRENGMRTGVPDEVKEEAKATDQERIERRNQRAPWSLAGATKTTLTNDEAYELGRKHFKDGYDRLVPTEISLKHGHAARDWYRGWDRANLDEPIRGQQTVSEPVAPSPEHEKPATIPKTEAREPADEQRGDQGSDQSQLDSSRAGSGVDQEPAPAAGRDRDGRGEGDEDAARDLSGDEPAGGVVRDPGRVSDRPADARVGEAPPNFLITDDFALGEGTDGQKLEANLAALRLVKTLETENRFATAEEQAILARWVGWGGLKTLFDEKHAGTSSQWGRAQAELKSLLTKTEYFDAMRSTADAHYTSRTVIEAMWQAMRNFGFTGGRALEPTIGSGNFLGLQPGDLSGATDWYASELDPITGLIAKHLYPRATVFDGTGFQDAPFRRSTFDIAIGNPPFGGDSSRVSNKDMHPDLGRMKVHNFVIAKTGQLLREGGIMGMVVTHRFLDAMDAEARDTLAPNFHFLGAIRLPNTAFKANAGAEVTTDIVFFQKRRAGDEQGDTSWLETGSEGPNGTRMNAWFAANPDMILGRPAMDGTMYAAGRGQNEFTVHDDGRDLADALAEAVGKIKATLPPREQALEAAVTAPRAVATLGYSEMMLTDDGRIFRGEVGEDGAAKVEEITEKTFWRENAAAQFDLVEALRPFVGNTASPGPDATQEVRNAASAVGLIDLAGDPVQAATKFEQALADAIPALLFGNPSAEHIAAYEAYAKRVEAKRLGTDGFDRLSGILSIRGQVKSLIRAEREGDPAMEQMRAKLRKDYRAFKSAFGYLNNSKNEAILQGDVGPEMALEVKYKAANRDGRAEAAEEAPILSKRVIYPHKIPDRVDGVPDAIHVSMQEKGALDPDLISPLTGKSVPEVIAELTAGEKPLAFKNPATGNFEMAEVYLSGNLAEKIEKAKQARAYDHIPHLKAAMPPPKTKEQITASIRSMWIPPDVFEDFLRAMGYQNPSVSIMEKVGMSAVEYIGTASSEFGQQFTTDRIDAGQVFEAALRGKIPVIYDTFRDASGEKRVKNEEATKEAVAAYERMSAEFPEWAYANPIRAARIVDAFNEKVNVVTPRKYEGTRYLRTVGTSPLVELRNSQKNGAWRMIQDKVTLLHHVVGAGKTMTGITGVMERKRMGLTRKAVVVVPNHLTGQWGKEWLELYPAANILVPTEKDFDPANRSKLINRIATGDFDAVIIGHSQMVKIDNDQEIVTRYIEEELDALNDVLQQQKKAKESRRTVAQIGNRIAKLKEKLSRINEDLEKRRGAGLLSWRELGVDYLVLDEAQEFKNLEYATSATQLVGMNDPNGSQKAFDLLMKIRSLQDIPNGGVAFMTGTPISNSLVEIYSVMKYLIPDSLDAMGIKHFDAWKAAFIQDESRFEYTASMQLKERNVMAGMVNLGPLAELYRSFADIVMRPDVERMYREQMEAKNKAQADASKHVSTRFPTPKVKTGKRRILLAKPTERMQEFTRYLVMRMAGIKNAPNKKEYARTDNPLWVLTDARKASVDIRTIDPEIGREEGSKVTRSAAEIYRIWKANTSRNGTQLVFSDMSTPSKTAEKAAKAILKEGYAKIGLKKDDLKRRIARDEAKTFAARWADLVGDIEDMVSSPATSDERRDALRLWSETPAVQDAAAAMLTADTGFSFYDDLKAMLVEKGIPEREIAFIHDFDTTAKKKELFEAVNDGKVRVLIGSTMKMGAGTNAQKRLVALHHIDAPWRPSDMEQREGRIIRQGNLFYEQDPEGFEVEILAYSTEKTADVVQWQVLERKAKAIETFLGAAADTLQEEGGDADQYAEFMAQSTGKKVFLQKMQVEKDLIKARGAIASALRSRSEAKRFVEGFDAEQDHLSARAAAFSAVDAGIFPDGATDYLSEWTGQIEAYRAARDAAEAEADAVRKRNAGKPRKEWERLPEQPNAPQRWQERPSNAWEAKVYDALKRGHDRPGTSPQTIALGKGFSIEIRTSTPGDGGGLVTYTAHLVPPGGIKGADIMLTEWPGVSAKEFRKSDKLLAAFDPAGIIYRAEERAKTAAARIVQHRDMLPQMQEVLAKPVDETAVTDLQTRLSALSAEARIEEVKYAEETASAGSNHFAEIDTKGRNLGAATDEKPITGQFQFQSGGRSYASEWGAPAGRRRITGTDIFGEVAYFEAEDMDSGERAIVEAIRPPQQKDGPEQAWTVENVFSYATDGGELEMRKPEAAPVATLTGGELGPWEDIRQLGKKAAAWYRANLTGKAVTNAETGMVIIFTSAGAKKLSGRKGDILYRSVPALREIIEKGRLVQTADETKGRDHIKAWHSFAATVVLDGKPRDLVAHVMETRDGHFHYDLSRDMSDGARFMLREAETAITGSRYGLEDNPVDINLDLAPSPDKPFGGDDPEITEADIMAITREMNAEIERTGISGKVNARVVRELYSRTTGHRIYGRMDHVGYRRGEISIEARRRDEDGVDPIGVMRHEIIHALRSEGLWNRKGGLFTEAEWRELVAAARAEPGIVKSVAERYPHLDQPKRVEEMVAELYRLWMGNRDGYSSVERIMLKIEGFLQALANIFRGKGFVSAARTMEQIATGKIGGRGPRPGGGRRINNGPNFSDAAEMRGGALPGTISTKAKGMLGNLHWKKAPAAFSNLLTDAMGRNARFNLLSLVPGDPLFTELGKNLASAQEYVGMKRDMDADRNKWQARAAGVVDRWTAAARRNPTANAALMDLMHESTLAGIDPSLDEGWKRAVDAEADRVNSSDTRFRQEWASDVKAERAGRQAMHFTLREKLEALPKEFRDLYSEIRSEYSAMADAMDTALVENIKAQSRITIKKADREHKKELARIRDEGLEGQTRMDAIGKANEKRSKAHARAARGEGSRVKQLRELFEKNRLQGPYFPLARFGNYFVTIRDADGRVVSFSRFETAGEQKAWAESEEAKDLGQVKTGVLGTSETDRKDVDPRFIADIEGILEEAGADRKTMDMVYQRWLETLPDQSIRTAQIHRKGRAGFNRDAIRAFSSAMFHGAHQTARLRFGAEMEESLDAAEEEAREAADPNREGFIVREMKQRHAFTMQPTNNPWVSKATGLAFVWYLGMSPAAAMVNLSQTTVVGVPMMAAKYRKAGVAGSIRALTRASRDFMRGQGKSRTDTWSAENAKTLTADERRAMKQGYDRGVIDKTQAHDLASVADSGVEYNPVREKVMRIIGFAFHHAERFNREVTYLAAYRLAREEGMSHDVAVSSAASMVWRTHFDYSNTSKPRAMQGDTAKVFLIFRNFQVNMLWRLFRDTHQSLRGATTEERAEARAQLIGITLSMMGHAGIRGVWGYGLIMGLLSLFFPGDSDDLDEWLQDALLMEGDDPLTASWNFLMGMALNGVPGHALGVDLTNRIGMPELWFRAPDKDLEGKDLWAFFLEQLAGPFFGIAGNMFTGASQIMDGQFLRGAEKMVPTFVRNTIKTGRYATEGVTTYYGDDLVDGLNPWQLLMQLSGFSPAEVAEQYEINNRLKRREKRIEDERKDLHRAATDALRDGSGVPASVMEKIRDFNRRHPEYPITGDTIKKSLQGRLRASARNESGVSLNPKLNDRLRGELAPSIY